MKVTNHRSLLICVAIMIGVWFLPVPAELAPKAWKMFAIFVGTIAMIVSNALPMGAAALVGLTLAVLTNVLSFQAAFQGYTDPIVWLVLGAFFLSYAFTKTGLGQRIAYRFVLLLGKTNLGLGYGLAITELILAPAIPSMTARTGGIVFPIVKSLSLALNEGRPNDKYCATSAYLVLVAFQSAVITGAMFLTAMAANPLIAKLAANFDLEITWATWTVGAFVPGLVSLIILPALLYILVKPGGPNKQTISLAYIRAGLEQMGGMTRQEIVTALVFIAMIILWIIGPQIDISAPVTVLLGICSLLITNILSWDELLELNTAWGTFIWFGALVAMATGLNDYGITVWVGDFFANYLSHFNFYVAIGSLLLVYFYSHYFFASNTAHVGAMFLPFLSVAIKLQAPPLVIALLLGYMSNLFGGLTHYTTGPAPILFGAGYVPLKTWWRLGFLMSVVNLLIWISIGLLWWKQLGYF